MPKTAKKEEAKNKLALIREETVESVRQRIEQFKSEKTLHLPENYSADNAMKSAWLILQNTFDKDKQPVLQVCTQASIANALLDMVVQGLNPAKMQCYFIAYGRILTMSRSYQGNKAICLRVDKELYDIHAECVYEGDKLKYGIKNGMRVITNHEQILENVIKGKIIAAYCTAIKADGEPKRTELMTMDEIKQAWAQSRMKPVTDAGNIRKDTTHYKFTAEMCKKTVTNRMAKHIIGTSDDSSLKLETLKSIKRTDDLEGSAYADNEIEEHANQGEVIDIPNKTPAEETKPPADENESPAGDEMTDEEKAEILAEEQAAAEKEAASRRGGKAPF